ncbi:MAG TPA: phosphate ABC transporter permease PstA [Candidatus Omnitrophota bacterium]|nr:phosphate ABC transporter permease PstA [Candidatus Omnitrophota bacterium]HRY85336.1 phosphate ABC transporter permease PstA [Candidatus Omnitrophota bacterium]
MSHAIPLRISQLIKPRTRLEEIFLDILVRIFALIPIGALSFIMFKIIQKGAGVITWEFLTQPPLDGMTHGGIFPCIFGTFAITLLMILMALPLGVAAAIYLVEFAGPGLFFRITRAAVNNLAGVPSIVFGLFGVGFFILFVGRNLDKVLQTGLLFGQPCMLWAAATLAVLVLPVIIVSTEEALNAVPQSQRAASLALGATKWQTIWRVVLPQARGGILTGAILSISRGAGETAPILFTGCAYFLPRLPVTKLFGVIPMINPFDQFMELSYHIFIMATQSLDAVKTLPIQYGTTLVLIAMTFLLNLAAISFRVHFRKKMGTVSV